MEEVKLTGDLSGFDAWRSQTQVLDPEGRQKLVDHILCIAKQRMAFMKEGNALMVKQTENTLLANHFIFKDFPDETHLWNREQGIEIILSREEV